MEPWKPWKVYTSMDSLLFVTWLMGMVKSLWSGMRLAVDYQAISREELGFTESVRFLNTPGHSDNGFSSFQWNLRLSLKYCSFLNHSSHARPTSGHQNIKRLPVMTACCMRKQVTWAFVPDADKKRVGPEGSIIYCVLFWVWLTLHLLLARAYGLPRACFKYLESNFFGEGGHDYHQGLFGTVKSRASCAFVAEVMSEIEVGMNLPYKHDGID